MLAGVPHAACAKVEVTTMRCAVCAVEVEGRARFSCAGCENPLCKTCEAAKPPTGDAADKTPDCLCPHCTTVWDGGVGDIQNCSQGFRALSQCCGQYVEFFDPETQNWQRGMLHVRFPAVVISAVLVSVLVSWCGTPLIVVVV